MKHVVGLSGGKDSTALALRLAEIEPRDYEYIFTPTGRELPELKSHLERLESHFGKKIIKLTNGDKTLDDLIQIQNALPNNRMRWCTRILKIQPTIAYCVRNAPCIMYVGLRADEELREGIYGDLVQSDFPFKRWGWDISHVLSYNASKGFTVDFRTDCDYCYDQRLIEWWRLWKYYPERWQEAKVHELKTGKTFRSPSRDTWPAALCEMEKRFESGDIPKERGTSKTVCRVCSL